MTTIETEGHGLLSSRDRGPMPDCVHTYDCTIGAAGAAALQSFTAEHYGRELYQRIAAAVRTGWYTQSIGYIARKNACTKEAVRLVAKNLCLPDRTSRRFSIVRRARGLSGLIQRDEWTPEVKRRLAVLWAQRDPQLSASEIGRQLGVSKSAVIGKAHRLGLLPARESPIRRDPAKPRKPRAIPALPPLPSVVVVPEAPKPVIVASPPVAPVAFKPIAAASKCQWPMGDPGREGFRFCEGAAVGDRPYCDEHCGVAYLNWRP